MTTPPNTELKSAEILEDERMYLMGRIASLSQDFEWKQIEKLIAERDRAIQHNAMLAMIQEAKLVGISTEDLHESDSKLDAICKWWSKAEQAILTRAEQILKGEK